MASSKGTIKLDRNLIDGDLWDSPAEWLKVWIYILLKVVYTPSSSLRPGQWVFRFERERIPGVSHDQWNRALTALKKRGSIKTIPVRQGVIVEVLNWPKYQAKVTEAQMPIWFTQFAAAWKVRTGGQLHPRACDDLKPLVDANGDQHVLANWNNYLASVEPRYLNPSKFAETFGSWVTPTRKEAHGKGKNGRSRQQLAGHTGTTDYSALDNQSE